MVKMGTVWDRTAEFLTDNVSALLPVALFTYFVPFSISGSFQHVLDNASFELALVLQLVSLGFAILAVWGSLTIICMVFESAGRAPATSATRALAPTVLVSAALVLAVCALFAPSLLALVGNGYDVDEVTRGDVVVSPAIRGLLAINLVVALPILLWAFARLVLLNPVIVAERRMFGAIARSFALTRGATWRILGVVVLYGLVSIVAVLATQLVFGSIFTLIAGPAGGLSLSGVLTSVMIAAVQAGFTLLAPVFTARLYLALAPDPALAPAS